MYASTLYRIHRPQQMGPPTTHTHMHISAHTHTKTIPTHVTSFRQGGFRPLLPQSISPSDWTNQLTHTHTCRNYSYIRRIVPNHGHSTWTEFPTVICYCVFVYVCVHEPSHQKLNVAKTNWRFLECSPPHTYLTSLWCTYGGWRGSGIIGAKTETHMWRSR